MLASLFTGSTFRYVFMPQFLPRMSSLMFGGFQYFPYLLAIVFRNARLLPANHPYLFYGNSGRFGVRHVMAQAGSNLRFSLSNIDQIVLFLIVIAAIVLVVVQILSIGAFFFLSSAMALPTNWNDFFVIQNPVARSQDIASILLDMVFGVPYLGIVGPTGSFSFFESCIGMPGAICTTNSPLVAPDFIVDIDLSLTPAAGLPADEFSPLSTNANARFPFPYHRGLHSLFGVYSQGLLVVGIIILSYFIATVLAETAQTGTPFGRRYNKLWVPIRIVMAFGLLMPLGGNPISAALGVGTGLNSAQYVVLYAAKYGSAFASNGWRIFNNTIGQPYLGNVQDLVSVPNPPDLTGFLHFMYVANVCEQIYEFYAGNTDTIRMWVHGDELSGAGAALQIDGTTTYNTAVAQLGGRGTTMVISFGEQNATKYEKERGNVMPLCGQIRWTLADARPGLTAPPAGAETAVYTIQEVYWRIMRDLWHNNTPLTAIPPNAETTGANRRDIALVWREIAEARPNPCTASEGSCTPHGYQVDQNFKRGVEEAAKALLRAAYLTLPATAIVSASWTGPWSGPVSQLYFKGWGAAGIWYNSIAAMNGNITFAALNPPTPSRYPSVMERVREIKMKHETNMSPSQMFNPNVPGLQDISGYVTEGNMNKVAQTLYAAYRAWDPSEGSTTQNRTTKNPIIDMISAIFGTNGLYAMRNNPSVHPLAQLVGIGASLVHTAARNLGIAGIATVTGIGLGDIVEGAGSLGSTLGSLAVSIASIAMTIGFVLYYVLPFLPFVYFFFAMGGWVKGIFEALVGAPLWALAHIRIDGQGLPGNAALNGYFLIFEIFVRPILILFGFLASISIFSALVSTLHSVFPLMTSNLSGFEGDAISDPGVASIVTYMRGRVDQFFFTIMYAVMVYMIGMSSFKLIDLIPNNILRWMGQSVATFNDMREDAVQGLMSRASMGAQQVVPKVAGGLNSVIAAAKS